MRSTAPRYRHIQGLRAAGRALSYLLTDEAYAAAIAHYRDNAGKANKHWYFLGAGLGLWTCWQASTAIGIFLGTEIPRAWSLDFTLALTFIALVVPALKTRRRPGGRRWSVELSQSQPTDCPTNWA